MVTKYAIDIYNKGKEQLLRLYRTEDKAVIYEYDITGSDKQDIETKTFALIGKAKAYQNINEEAIAYWMLFEWLNEDEEDNQ